MHQAMCEQCETQGAVNNCEVLKVPLHYTGLIYPSSLYAGHVIYDNITQSLILK